MTSKIADNLGRLFEVGFNIGILAYIQHYKIKHNFGNLYIEELQQLKLPKMLKQIVNQVISTVERDMADKWGTFFIQKGFLSGLNFFGEYIQSVGWSEPHQLKNVEILYFQCRFSGDNSIGTYEDKNTRQWFREVLRQLDIKAPEIEEYIKRYVYAEVDLGKKGEFVNADTLMLLRYRQQMRILCVDLSVFSINSDTDVKNIDYVEIIRSLLKKDISYLRSKSVFSELRIDTESLGLEFSEDLQSYFTAFKYRDKETTKLIQAGGYAYSFYEFLQETGIINEKTSVVLNAVGYSDRGLSAMSITPENINILKTCYQIYKHDSSPKQIDDARKQVLNRIKRSAYHSFDDGKYFIDKLLAIPANQTTIVTHQEQITGFCNSVDQVPEELMHQLGLTGTMHLRQAHAKLIHKALESEAIYLFLTGNPGIGKTTAIVNFLKSHVDEGFLFFYVSPRKQVNLDIIEKFKADNSEELCDSRIFAINTHSNLITDNSGQYTVQYLWNQRRGTFTKRSVNFVDGSATHGKRLDRLQRKTEDVIQDGGHKTRGVLNSICEAISTLVDFDISNNIVATVSIQSLKETQTENTLKHFEKVFRTAYNQRVGAVIPSKMQDISKKIKHLFIMIDEITGDDGGVAFLNGIHQIVSKYELANSEHGFNTKVIVADASIVDRNIIKQHLDENSPEPDKIYFRKTAENCQPLSQASFEFKNLPAMVINSNSYPAKSLSITYKILLDSYKFSETTRKENRKITKILQAQIFQDLETLLNRGDVDQVIVYIQNKQRLTELIESIRKYRLDNFEPFQDYLEIHANISEVEKQQINQCKNDVKIVFMTASGSRGLSFPKAKHILVEIPGFQIEKNLMEVIQVIYRGRGNDKIDSQDKELFFYLAESSVYSEDDQQSLQESILSLLNILLILKAAIMTRIVGYGKIGRDKFIIIPIGGKSVFAAGESFSGQMANLISQLKKEHNINQKDILLEKVYTSLEYLLGQAEFVVRETTQSNYLTLQKSFNTQFSQCDHLGELLKFGNIEHGYLCGSLLVVPIANKTLEETYQIGLLDIATHANQELWRNMQEISRSTSYPENLRAAVKDAIELVKKLRDIDKSQKLEQYSQHSDQYYALPLFAFISGDVMRDYFATQPEEPEDETFRKILANYIRLLYPVGNILPISDKYREFPFVVFRSYSLKEMRKKYFTNKYLLTSNELNVLNLILSKDT